MYEGLFLSWCRSKEGITQHLVVGPEGLESDPQVGVFTKQKCGGAVISGKTSPELV